ncbi:MAG TPA: hypothetical protein VKH19_02830 [Gemmatimonadaceae bacterium]|nr:hypothetical protein [Gemmatimonadaceae bacterium]
MPPIIPLAIIMCSSIIVIVTIIARAFTQNRRLPPAPPVDGEVLRRLDRIEQLVESMTLEQERIGESNRFLVRLLAARTDGAPAPSIEQGERA